MKAQQNGSGAEGRCLSKFNIRHTKVVIKNIIFSLKNSTLLDENKVQYILMHDHGNFALPVKQLRQISQHELK